MASLSVDAGTGRSQIQFRHPNGKRHTLRLGKVAKRLGEGVLFRVQEMIAAVRTGQSLSADTAAWLGATTPELYDKLVRVELVPPRQQTRQKDTAIDEFLLDYINGRKKLQPNTMRNLRRSHQILSGHFGKDRRLQDISPGDADELHEALIEKYSPVTVAREIKRARQFFKSAVRQGLIDANPFSDVKAGSQANSSRSFFVTREMASAVLDACPDNEWRLIFALSRFGGLRCPSETLALQWSDVDWERSRIMVRDQKTKQRVLPLFGELRPYLQTAFEEAEEGGMHVIQRYRSPNANLRTQLLRIISRASLTPWPRLFHNLRASRETELASEFPIHVVCDWIGNSIKVARDHYLQVTEAHFEKATSNPTSHMHAEGRTEPHPEKETAVYPANARYTAVQVPPRGVEPRFSD